MGKIALASPEISNCTMASHELLPRLVANGDQSSYHDYYSGDQSMSSEFHWSEEDKSL